MNEGRFHVPTGVTVALVTAAVATASQYPMIQAQLSDQYEALQPYGGMGVTDLVEGHFDSTQERFLAYAKLREHARGARLVMFSGAGLYGEQLYGLSGLSDVAVQDYEPQVGPDTAARILAAEVAAGTDETAGPWSLAVSGEVEELVAVRHDGRLLIADRALFRADRPAPE